MPAKIHLRPRSLHIGQDKMNEIRAELFSQPGSAAYRAATNPRNSSVVQRPAIVAHPRNAQEVAQAVQRAAQRNLGVTVQASGHGAGAPIESDRVLVDTSGLNSVRIDAQARVATVGVGATWSAVNAVAEREGLLGLAGTSPTVAVAGYTFGGGVGFLTRLYGMASSALLAVDYVDGNGQMRRAEEDAPDAVDREALWAFRGGGGVGMATALTVELVAPQELWAGYQLWTIDALGAVIDAWRSAVGQVGDALSTSIRVLHTPPGAPTFPSALQGVPILHLAFASPQGPDAAGPLLRALQGAPPPVVDSSWAPADAARLARIHLDPRDAVPALGLGRWLGPSAPAVAANVLDIAAAADAPVAMAELRHVGNEAQSRDGATTTVPGPFLLHAVGVATDVASRVRTEDGLSQVYGTAIAADIGRSAASFADGRAMVSDALDSSALQRLGRLSAALDPDHRLAPSRVLAALNRDC